MWKSSLQPLFEMPFKKLPSIAHLRPFASSCYVHIPEEHRSAGKLNSRAERARFVSYNLDGSDAIYKVITTHLLLKRLIAHF